MNKEGPESNLPYMFTVIGEACEGSCTNLSATGLAVSGILGNGNCSVPITGIGTGKAIKFTGTGGYLYGNTFRTCDTHRIVANNIKLPGTYTLQVGIRVNQPTTCYLYYSSWWYSLSIRKIE